MKKFKKRKLTLQELRNIKYWHETGMTYKKIGKVLKRTPSSVSSALWRMRDGLVYFNEHNGQKYDLSGFEPQTVEEYKKANADLVVETVKVNTPKKVKQINTQDEAKALAELVITANNISDSTKLKILKELVFSNK